MEVCKWQSQHLKPRVQAGFQLIHLATAAHNTQHSLESWYILMFIEQEEATATQGIRGNWFFLSRVLVLPSLKATQVVTQCFCPFLDSCLHPYLPSWWYSSWVHVRWATQQVLVVKNPPANEGDASDAGPIPGLGRSPGVENDSPLQYSCLENPMDGRARRATAHGAAKSQTWLSS